MKFKKLLTTAMAAALAVSAFAGCGAQAEESTETAQTAESTGEYATPSHWYGIPMNLQKIMTLPAANMLV